MERANIETVQLCTENVYRALKLLVPKTLLSYLTLIISRYLDVYDVSRWYVG